MYEGTSSSKPIGVNNRVIIGVESDCSKYTVIALQFAQKVEAMNINVIKLLIKRRCIERCIEGTSKVHR